MKFVSCSYETATRTFELPSQRDKKKNQILWLFPKNISLLACDQTCWDRQILKVDRANFWKLPDGILSIFSMASEEYQSPPIEEMRSHEHGIYTAMLRLCANQKKTPQPQSLGCLKLSLQERQIAIARYIQSWIKSFQVFRLNYKTYRMFIIKNSENSFSIVNIDQKQKQSSITTDRTKNEVEDYLYSLATNFARFRINQPLHLLLRSKNRWKYLDLEKISTSYSVKMREIWLTIIPDGNERIVIPIHHASSDQSNLASIFPSFDKTIQKVKSLSFGNPICTWRSGLGLSRTLVSFAQVGSRGYARVEEVDHYRKTKVRSFRLVCDNATKSFIQQITREENSEKRDALCANFDLFYTVEKSRHNSLITAIEVQPLQSKNKRSPDWGIRLQKINYPSKIQPGLYYDYECWTVSLCATAPSSAAKNPLKKYIGHAVIIMESVDEGVATTRGIHIAKNKDDTDNSIELACSEIPEKILDSISWQMPKRMLTPLLNKYSELVQNGRKNKTENPFHKLCPRKGQNCISWAVDMLQKCYIDLPDYQKNKLLAMSPKKYIRQAKEHSRGAKNVY